MKGIFEAGIGCDRALVIEDGLIVEAHLELPGLRVGDIWHTRVVSLSAGTGLTGLGASVHPMPPGATEGMMLAVEVVREPIDEPDRSRPARLNALGVASGEAGRVRAGPTLSERLRARGMQMHIQPPHGPDLLESAGWSETLEEARTGRVVFPGGELVCHRTAAFETIDVDGHLPPSELALAAAPAVAAAIRRFDLTGTIVIDFPTLGSRAARAATDAALEVTLPRPFERTAMNGFGLVQIIRPKLRLSLMDRMQGAPAFMAALALLRQAERTPGAGTTTLAAPPAVASLIAPHHLSELERRTGRPARVLPDLAGSSLGYVNVTA